MGQKLLAGVVAVLALIPICATCILGPAVVGSVVAGAFGWLGGLDPAIAAGVAILAGVVAYRVVSRRKSGALRCETNPSGDPVLPERPLVLDRGDER